MWNKPLVPVAVATVALIALLATMRLTRVEKATAEDPGASATSPKEVGFERGHPVVTASSRQIEPDEDSHELFPLLKNPDASITATLKPWVDQFRAERSGADQFNDYGIFEFDDNTLEAVKQGNVRFVEINISKEANFTIEIGKPQIQNDNWYFSGHLIENPDATTVLTVFPDGSKWGEVHVPGHGLYIIRPASIPPYHIVYLATGTYDID